LVVSLFKTLII